MGGEDPALGLHRLTFAFTINYHYLFPQLTMGLAFLIVVLKTLAPRQPQIRHQLGAQPTGHLLTLLALAGLLGAWHFSRPGAPEAWDLRAFLASCVFLASLLGVTAFGLYPFVLPSNGDPALGLTVHNSGAPAHALQTALYWWLPGIALASGYTVFVYRRFAGRVQD